MARSPDEIDFEQYYEDWRHRDNLTWQIPAVTIAIGSGIIIGAYMDEISPCIRVLAFGLGAFFIAALTVMLAQNLYYQWRDERHLDDCGKKKNEQPQSGKAGEKRGKKGCWNKLCQKLRLIEDYGREENGKPQSRPIPRKVDEEDGRRTWDKLGRMLGPRRMGSTLLLITCFLFYGSLSYLFGSTWQWCWWCILVLVITFLGTFGWFSLWLICIGRN